MLDSLGVQPTFSSTGTPVDIKEFPKESYAIMTSPIVENVCRVGLRRRDSFRLLRCSLLLLLLLMVPLISLMVFTTSRGIFHFNWASRRNLKIDTPLEPRGTCSGFRLLLLIPTAPDQRDRREAIRETWATGLRNSPLRLIFVIGKATSVPVWTQIVDEWRVFGDILYRPDFSDAYERLTQKTLLAFDWATRSCHHVPFIAKVDSDVFLRADNLIRFLQHLPSPSSEFILGQVNVRGLPKRNPSSRWFASRQLYPAGSYPNYVFGAFYLMPSVTARRLVDSVEAHELEFAARLRLEDVFITGILARRLGVNRRHVSAFLQEVPKTGEVCSHPKLISVHRIAPKQMRRMWQLVNDC